MKKNDKTEFRCLKCGECCRHIDHIEALREYDRGDGTCIYLEDSMCSIYYNRPLICNIELMYETCYVNLLSKADYYKLNYQGCAELMNMYKKEDG